MKNIVILGSTGSIGVNTLKVIDNFSKDFRVIGLTGYNNLKLLEKQIKKYRPKVVVAGKYSDTDYLRSKFKKDRLTVLAGPEGLKKIASWPKTELVVSALVGALGLEPTQEAILAGRDIALANKEVLVMAGSLMMKSARQKKISVLPLDSEHSAIWQCLKSESSRNISRIILTASGGPFWRLTKDQLRKVNPANALRHPTWNMGKKVTIDSATLMNKGFEVIEAHHLFGVPLEKIEVVIHPESVVHSMVEFCDGSTIAQMATADMRLPIQYALCYSQRRPNRFIQGLDFAKNNKFTFVQPDWEKFPCLRYGYQAAQIGGTMPAVMSAADEVAVQGFLDGAISFPEISQLIKVMMKKHTFVRNPALADIIEAAEWARQQAQQLINN